MPNNRDVDFNDCLKEKWTDKYVAIKENCPEIERFKGIVGRVVTVNFNGKAVVDFQDGGWYDITASEEYLEIVDPEEGAKQYKNVNSAQLIPEKQ